jgi:large subunit ribosomal protein L11
MAKKIKTYVKLNVPAGAATAAPPVGPALGQHGLPIMDFVKAFNERTKDRTGNILPVVITVFITKEPPIAEMIKKAIGKDKGAGKAGHETIATLTKNQVEDIAKAKLPDLNTKDIEAAGRIVAGVARSMGVKVS